MIFMCLVLHPYFSFNVLKHETRDPFISLFTFEYLEFIYIRNGTKTVKNKERSKLSKTQVLHHLRAYYKLVAHTHQICHQVLQSSASFRGSNMIWLIILESPSSISTVGNTLLLGPQFRIKK